MKTPKNGRREKKFDSGKIPSLANRNPLSRFLSLALFALVGTVGIICLVVFLTPLEPLEETDPNGSSSKTSQSALSRPDAESKFEVPSTPEVVDTVKLRKELESLAAQLQKDYENDAGAFHTAAQIYASLNQTELAEKAWKRSIELKPIAEGPFLGLAEMHNQSGRSADAIQVLRSGREQGYRSELMDLRLAEALENEGQPEEANEIIREALQRIPNNSELLLVHGRILNQLGDFPNAELSLKKHLAVKTNSEAGWVLLSSAQIRQGKKVEALATQQKIVEIQKRQKESKVSFQQTYEESLREIATDMLLAAASVDEEQKQLEQAEKKLKRLLQLSPRDAQACMSLAMTFRKRNRVHSQLEVQRYLLHIQPDNLLNYINLASVAFQTQDVALARSTLFDAIKLDSQGIVAQAAIARLESSLLNHKDACYYAELVVERDPSVESYLLLANIRNAAGQRDLADDAIAEAKKLDPNNSLFKNDPR